MKKIFIPVISKIKLDKNELSNLSKSLPKNIEIAYSIQYKDLADKIKEYLKDKNIHKIIQVLGCSNITPYKNTQAILLISDGKFHAIPLFYNKKIPVYVFNGLKLTKLSKKDIINYEKIKKTSQLNFLYADKVGILISIKPGQQRFDNALNFKNKIKNKKAYLFIGDNLNANEFENFPEIKSWINSACPRLDMENPKIINLNEVKELLNLKKSK